MQLIQKLSIAFLQNFQSVTNLIFSLQAVPSTTSSPLSDDAVNVRICHTLSDLFQLSILRVHLYPSHFAENILGILWCDGGAADQ